MLSAGVREAEPAADELDDYLGLLEQSLAGLRLLVFYGASGSGKSSQIALLRARHPDLQAREVVTVAPNAVPTHSVDVLVIDEIQTLRQCVCLTPALRRCTLLLLASHVPPALLWPWRLGRAHRCVALDPLGHKLERELTRRGVRFSGSALATFVARFGANYTDLDIVLEHGGEDDLDRALARFLRGSSIRHG